MNSGKEDKQGSNGYVRRVNYGVDRQGAECKVVAVPCIPDTGGEGSKIVLERKGKGKKEGQPKKVYNYNSSLFVSLYPSYGKSWKTRQ